MADTPNAGDTPVEKHCTRGQDTLTGRDFP